MSRSCQLQIEEKVSCGEFTSCKQTMFVYKQMYSKQTMTSNWLLKGDEVNCVHWQKTQNVLFTIPLHHTHVMWKHIAQHNKPDRSIKFKQEFPHEVMQGEKKPIKLDYGIKGLCVLVENICKWFYMTWSRIPRASDYINNGAGREQQYLRLFKTMSKHKAGIWNESI